MWYQEALWRGKKRRAEKAGENVVDYRHKNVKRLNIPPAGLTARGEIVREKKVRYAYNPHLSPALRFDATGKADSIEKLIEDASRRKLEPGRNQTPPGSPAES